jgi:hypothetical protein
MNPAEAQLWHLARSRSGIDANQLAAALAQVDGTQLEEPRTANLIRDAHAALARRWGESQLSERLRAAGHLDGRVRTTTDDPRGFPHIERKIVEPTRSQDILAFFRELGSRVRQPAALYVGGSTALILKDLIVHQTEDIDIVDEVPAIIRTDYVLLESLAARFGLSLTHFQSHYLPDGWRTRISSLGRFGNVEVFVVDAIDVLVGKLFSKRDKDFVHVRAALPVIDGPTYRVRLATATTSLRKVPEAHQAARHNWYVLTGESELP